MHVLSRRVSCAAFALLVAAASNPISAQTELPAATAQDVGETFHLLETTAYKQVDAQQIFDAARAALVDYAHRHGSAAFSLPPVTDNGDDVRALNDLDEEIESAAANARGNATDYAYAAMRGMASAFGDRYTVFMTPDEYRQFNDALDPQRISGIGVLVEQDSPYIRISYVLPNTPADRAGLREGDLIIAVNGTSARGLAVDGVSTLLRGKAGTQVSVELAATATSAGHTVTITRSEVQPPTVIFKMLPGDIGYVWVIAFGRATPDEFDVALQRLREQGARALVLDLRNDTGGYVDSALDISSHFVGKQPILTVEERGNRDTTIDSDNEGQVALPMTVLVNAYTASASEITAGALQDDGAATLMGTKTFGKGVMQTLTELPDGAAIKITTAHYLTPRHRDINLRGIEPDFAVDENRGAHFGELSHDAQLRAAVTYLQKKIAALPR